MTREDITLTSGSVITLDKLRSLPVGFIEAVLGYPVYTNPRKFNRSILCTFAVICETPEHLASELSDYKKIKSEDISEVLYKEILCYLLNPLQYQVIDNSYIHQYLQRFSKYMQYFHHSAYCALVDFPEVNDAQITYIAIREIIIDALCCLYDLNPNKPRKHMVIDDDKDCNATNSCE